MPRSSSEKTTRHDTNQFSIASFPRDSQLETQEQRRGFELLRLAFFALKLRKLEQRREIVDDEREFTLRCSLLRHAIFQQILTLTELDARDQALQLIDACRK